MYVAAAQCACVTHVGRVEPPTSPLSERCLPRILRVTTRASLATPEGLEKTQLPQILLNGNNIAMVRGLPSPYHRRDTVVCVTYMGTEMFRITLIFDRTQIVPGSRGPEQ